jgi:hypothetical protein
MALDSGCKGMLVFAIARNLDQKETVQGNCYVNQCLIFHAHRKGLPWKKRRGQCKVRGKGMWLKSISLFLSSRVLPPPDGGTAGRRRLIHQCDPMRWNTLLYLGNQRRAGWTTSNITFFCLKNLLYSSSCHNVRKVGFHNCKNQPSGSEADTPRNVFLNTNRGYNLQFFIQC